ncbi:hypothetical protein TcasGA2_TC034811 [Tribolium castaneum]|uniref:Uncharacterized protein n=1 Tax=Tribolium castaneum TaxID=7070 RepID=A0A139WF74_TRICA|nr:hypothetical protein TcasGA2_TC034811 [Tribolium castaneum]
MPAGGHPPSLCKFSLRAAIRPRKGLISLGLRSEHMFLAPLGGRGEGSPVTVRHHHGIMDKQVDALLGRIYI